MRKTILCLGGGIEAIPVIRRARDMALKTVVVDSNPNAPGFIYADQSVVASCYHYESVAPALKGISPDAVLCCAVDAPIVAARLAEDYAVSGLPVEAAILSEDKFEQKKVLAKGNIPVPKFGMVHERADALTVVKPRDGRGGRGVIRILPGIDFDAAFGEASHGGKQSRDVITEEWLDGYQYSTESLVQGGRVLFTAVALRNYGRLAEFAPHVIEDGSDSPAALPGIDALIESACHVLKWDNCTVKGDIVMNKGKLYIIELAARLSGGFFCSHIIPWAYGMDLVGAAIRLAFGEPVRISPTRTQYVSQRYVFPAPEDIGKRVVTVPVWEMFGEFATWNIRKDAVVKPVTCHPDRWGQTICTGKTKEFARESAENVAAQMKGKVVLE